MRSFRKEVWYNIPTRRAFINITPQVEECLRESGIREGMALVNAMHVTASVFINDDESGLHHDYEVWLEKLAPHEPTSHYRHNRTGEDNGEARTPADGLSGRTFFQLGTGMARTLGAPTAMPGNTCGWNRMARPS